MSRALSVLTAALLLLGACSSSAEDATEAGAQGEGGFPRGRVIIDMGDDSLFVDVEIADTEKRRRQGLMNRKSLPPDEGMLFVFFEEHSGGFWMKDTLIPLSVAFFDLDGEIKAIVDMEPCRKDPCKIYDPGVTYRGALEVNRGAFDRWGVGEGDVINLLPRS